MSIMDLIISVGVILQTGWIFYLDREHAAATREQQQNLDRLNQAMAEHTHMVQVAGGSTPTHAPYYQERP